jgi:hypothetical protein
LAIGVFLVGADVHVSALTYKLCCCGFLKGTVYKLLTYISGITKDDVHAGSQVMKHLRREEPH